MICAFFRGYSSVWLRLRSPLKSAVQILIGWGSAALCPEQRPSCITTTNRCPRWLTVLAPAPRPPALIQPANQAFTSAQARFSGSKTSKKSPRLSTNHAQPTSHHALTVVRPRSPDRRRPVKCPPVRRARQ